MSRLAIVVGACAIVASGAHAQFDSKNVDLYSHLTPAQMGGTACSDLWGYVSPSGREYALSCLTNKLVVVEVSDPDQPIIVGSVPHTDCIADDVKVYGHYAYVSNDCSGGIDIVDLADVDDGVVKYVKSFTGGGLTHVHNIAINEDTGFLYLCIGNINSGRPVAIDLADPENPVIAGQMTSGNGGVRQHDLQSVLFTEGPYAGREILFGAAEGNGFDIIDATDKQNMVRLAILGYPGLSYAHNCWMTEDQKYVYLGDELDDGFIAGTRTLIFNVEDINNPSYVGYFTNGVPATDHNLYVKGKFVYEANYNSGLRVYDASDEEMPTEMAWFDTYPLNDNYGFDGAWTAYPFLPSGTVIVNDRANGLFAVDVIGDESCPADFNGDGNLNILDFIAFQNAFIAADPKADCDANATLDILDFICFQGVFQAGCP
jgi:choice-of-anchor B domain-containing protein